MRGNVPTQFLDAMVFLAGGLVSGTFTDSDAQGIDSDRSVPNGIGNGGCSNDVFEAITGLRGSSNNISSSSSASAVFAQVKKAIDSHLPISAGTHGEDEEALYTNTGVYADHSYSVVGYKEEGGKQYVQLRNPWGESEPAGDGKNDGIFFLKLDDFMKLYETVMTVR